MIIRNGTRKDIPAIIYIYNRTFIDTIFSPRKYYKKYIDRNRLNVLTIDKKVIGVFIWDINRSDNILENKVSHTHRYHWGIQLMIDPDYQSKGYGSIMINDFLNTGTGSLQKRLICEPKLVDWYKRFGFRVYLKTKHDGNDIYVMLLE